MKKSYEKTLKYLLDQHQQTNYTIFCTADFMDEFLIPLKDLEILSNLGLIKFQPYIDTSPENPFYKIELLAPAYTYFDKKHSEFLNVLFKSVLLPIITSLITTLIVSICSYIWGMRSLRTNTDNFNPNKQPITDEIIATRTEWLIIKSIAPSPNHQSFS